MRSMQVPFSPPDITEDDIKAVVEVLESGWITSGRVTKDFEAEIASTCSTSHAICLNSATAALECALRLLGVGPGDEVITSAYTYTASCSVICHVGATPVLVDVLEGSYQMDPDALMEAITERTKVIIPVDIGGVMADYDRLHAIAEEARAIFSPSSSMQELYGRIVILADAAHSFGAVNNGIPSGGAADFTAFSFHAVKNITTAEGGALTWRDNPIINSSEIYRLLSMMSLHGQSKDAFAKQQLGSWEYDILWPAYKCNMADMSAALGLSQLKRYNAILKRRSSILEQYYKGIDSQNAIIMPHKGSDFVSSMHLCMVNLPGKNEEFRNRLIQSMADRGVATNVHYKPLPMLTAYKELGFSIEDFPNSFAQYKNEITLPLNSRITNEEAEYVIEVFNGSFVDCEKQRV